uniref:Tetraspanin n=1 Tax=Haemonchus placei TaxID=6290 RepID=A0A0N4W1B2_HAEPC
LLNKFCYDDKRLFGSIFCVHCNFLQTIGLYSLGVGIWLYLERTDFHELTPTSFSVFSLFHCRPLLLYWCSGLDHLHPLVTGNGRVFDLTTSWDRLQKSLECCGVNNGSDWFYSSRWPSHRFVPNSCCDPKHFENVDSMNNCGKVDNSTLLFQQGCYEVFADWLYHHVAIMNWISFALLIAEVSSIPLCCSFLCYLFLNLSFHRDEYHRCLVEMNDLDAARDLRIRPMDRIGDAAQDP